MRRNRIRSTLLAGAFCTLLTLSVAAVQGTESDPLVTLGYLKDKFLPDALTQVEAKAAEQNKTMEVKLQAMVEGYTEEMAERFQKALSQVGQANATGFAVVEFSEGQTLVLSMGSEVLLRSGEAFCVAQSAPGLVDTSGGTTLADQQTLVENHLYLSTAEGRGVKARSAVCVLVRGGYTLS